MEKSNLRGNMNIKIVYATKEDVSKANEFLTRLIQDEKKYNSNINEKCVVKSFYEKNLNNQNCCILFAKNDEEIVGYLYGFFRDDSANINKISKLDAMFVDENYRGQKIADKLIEEFKRWSMRKDCKHIELNVCNSNIVAFNLYKKHGFKEVKTIMSVDLET